MHVLYEDDGFKTATLLSEADTSLQVETPGGKRAKLRKNSVVLRFESPGAGQLLPEAEALATGLDVPFLWECASQDEFAVEDLAADYFGQKTPTAVQITALLLCLHGAPVYFHRRGKGRYRAAPPDILEAALAAVEKKQRQAEQQRTWADALIQGTLPEPFVRIVDQLAFRPDKNSQEWKALDLACQESGRAPLRLLANAGAWPHALAVLNRRFLGEHFPKGTATVETEPPPLPTDLPVANVEAYSLDDASTTEIDDALSVQVLDDGSIRVGVHIAVPALTLGRDSPLDLAARQRMSTVYLPGDKIPMHPEKLIRQYSLDVGKPTPALSLYLTIDPVSGETRDLVTRLEQLTVAGNLRHPDLEPHITEQALNDESLVLPYNHWVRPLWRGALALARVRDVMRGRPEMHDRVEYGFAIDGDPYDPNQAHVRLVPRPRGAPLDRLVAEYMILANNTWGGTLDQHGVPGIYRSQQTGRVRMSTHALPHEAIGVPYYAWCTSPLRRYVDLVNQQQLLAIAQHGISARLAAPYKPRDADLFAIISNFDATYSAYLGFQDEVERFWCLRWLRQEGITRTEALVVRDDLVRFANAPLYTRIGGMPELLRGTRIVIDIIDIDELALEVECRLVNILEA